MADDLPLPPIDVASTALGDEVYRVLAGAILDGRLSPGQRLRDTELSQALGVSRTPIREAVQRLERLGLVEVSANRYTRVTQPSAAAFDHTREFMAYLAGDALRLALPRCTDDELAVLAELVDGMLVAARSGDAMAVLGATIVFYQQVIRASGNLVFAGILREAGVGLQRNLQGRAPYDPTPEDIADFESLHAAILVRDAAAADCAITAQTRR